MTDEEKEQELEDILLSGVATLATADKSISYKGNDQILQALEHVKRKTRTTWGMSISPYFSKGL